MIGISERIENGQMMTLLQIGLLILQSLYEEHNGNVDLTTQPDWILSEKLRAHIPTYTILPTM